MGQYLIRRLLQIIPAILGVIVITFSLGYFGPGDPIKYQIGEQIPTDAAQLQRLREYYGLDRPFLVQLGDYMFKLFQGDMGISLAVQPKRPVGHMLAKGLLISIQLGAAAALMTVFIGIPLGVLAAYKQNSWIDYIIVASSAILPTIPVFVLSPLLLILLVLKLDILPHSYGWAGLFDSRAILPVFVLTIGPLLTVVRQTRAGVLEMLSRDYVRTARAKGLSEFRVLVRHVLRNALTAVLTSMGFIAASLLTGSLFVESIFGIPGFGGIIFAALQSYDYPVILGTTLVSTLIILAANFTVDLFYAVLDPRVQYQ